MILLAGNSDSAGLRRATPTFIWRSIALAFIGVVLSACWLIGPAPNPPEVSPAFVCTPTVVGVVTNEETEPGVAVFTLRDGTVLRVGGTGLRRLSPGPTVGDLLLYGKGGPCGAFLARATPRDIPEFPGCLGFAQPARDDGEFIWFESGLRLPKAEGFVRPDSYSGGEGGSALACLNERGEVAFFN